MTISFQKSADGSDILQYAIVRVWETRGKKNHTFLSSLYEASMEDKFGHASLELMHGDKSIQYISFWPSTPPDSPTQFVKSEMISKFSDIESEEVVEGNKIRFFYFYSLDIAKILEFFNEIIQNPETYQYQLIKQNCSSIVLDLLKRGGLENLFPNKGGLESYTENRSINTVTPADIFNIATDAKQAELIKYPWTRNLPMEPTLSPTNRICLVQ